MQLVLRQWHQQRSRFEVLQISSFSTIDFVCFMYLKMVSWIFRSTKFSKTIPTVQKKIGRSQCPAVADLHLHIAAGRQRTLGIAHKHLLGRGHRGHPVTLALPASVKTSQNCGKPGKKKNNPWTVNWEQFELNGWNCFNGTNRHAQP